MFRPAYFIAIAIVCISTAGLSQPKPTKTPPPAQLSTKQDYSLKADTLYCDRALSYEYKPATDAAHVQLGVISKTGWHNYLSANFGFLEKESFNPFVTGLVVPPVSKSSSADSALAPDDPDFDPRKDGGWLYDRGDPLVSPANATMTAPRAQRLLVRTLFGPNPFTAPCSYNYRTQKNGPVDPHTPLFSPSGQLETPVAKGPLGPYHFSFLDKDAPDFYLINITQWTDAQPPTGATTTSAAKYYAATDRWFLLNFKHPERNQDITKLVFRAGLNPELVTDVPELMGKSVILLGIQLAPTVSLPSTPSTKGITPTEQSWFDDVKVEYKLHADSVTSLQMQDLAAFVQAAIAASGASNIFPSSTPPPAGGQSPNIAESHSVAVENVGPAAANLATIDDLVGEINEVAAKLKNSSARKPSALLMFLRGVPFVDVPRDYGLNCAKDCAPLLNYENSAEGFIAISNQVRDRINGISTDSTLSADQRAGAEAAATADLNADIAALKANKTSLDADLEAEESPAPAKVDPAIRSLYQGTYAAGLISNIQGLPLKITPSWTATFATASPTRSSQSVQPGGSAKIKPESIPAPISGMPPTSEPAHGPSPVADDPPPPTPDFLPEAPQSSNKTSAPSPDPSAAGKSGATASPKPENVPTASSQSGSPSTPPTTAPVGCTPTLADDKSSQAPCTATSSVTVIDEKFSHFDFTAAISVTGYKDLTIQSGTATGSSVTTSSTVTRENAYGIVDIFIVPENLVNPPRLGFPHFAVGLPFAGQIFDKPYFAVGETINLPKLFGKSSKLANVPGLNVLTSDQFPLQIHPVFGYVWNKESTTTNGVVSNNRNFRPQWAVEIPFRNVVDLVKNFTKSSSK